MDDGQRNLGSFGGSQKDPQEPGGSEANTGKQDPASPEAQREEVDSGEASEPGKQDEDEAADRSERDSRDTADEEDAGEDVSAEEDTVETPEGAVDVGVTKVDYTVRDRDSEPYPVVHVFGRTPEGDSQHVEVTGFRPYFYAPDHEVDDSLPEDSEQVVEIERGYTSIDGESVTRIYTRIPADVSDVREDYRHHEADILYPNRFRIDTGVKSGFRVFEDDVEETDDGRLRVDVDDVEAVDVDAPARTMVVDIEVEDRHGFPEDGEQPLICLTAWDSFDDSYHVFAWFQDDVEFTASDVAPDLDADVDVHVHEHTDEETMLKAFLSYLEDRDPDVTTGWNYEEFDAPYIIDRLEELGMDSGRLSRVGEVWHGGGWGGPTVKGRSTFDLLYGYQRMRFTELESYRLDAIAEEELGEQKVTYTGKLGDLWEEDPERLLEYNVVDVELCVEIDRKVGVVDFFRELSRFVGCSLEDSTTPSDVVDIYVLRKAYGEFVLPSKRSGGGGDEYEGGEVFEPITGIRENVAVLDLASLYPMSMISVNASPETKVSESYDGETYRVEMPDGSVVRFRKDQEGLTKSIVTELLEERDRKKALRDQHEMGSPEHDKYDDQQNAIKVVMNCFSPDTEVVTEEGVKDITDVDVGEQVYSIDPETKEVSLREVVETQKYEYEGEMVEVETRHTDFQVTPNHRMLVDVDGETEFVEAGELDDYTNYQIPNGQPVEGETPEQFSLLEEGEAEHAYVHTEGHGTAFKRGVGEATEALEYESNRKAFKCSPVHLRENPKVVEEADRVLLQKAAKHSSVPAVYDMEDWLRFVGWYVTEGSVYEIQPKEYESASRGRSQKIQLGQLDEGGRQDIVELLERMDLNSLKEERQITVCNGVLADWLIENCGSGSETKHLPEFVWSLDWRLLEVLFDTLMQGDGDRYSGLRYSTKSTRLKDDVVRLAVHLGYKPMVNRGSGVWRIRFTDNEGSFRMHRNGGESTSDGRVYCVTVEDDHTVLAGRNGKFQWVGQSYYGVAGYERFRLYDSEMGAAVTATGRKVIEHTRDEVERMGYDVIYGDSVTGDRPVVLRDPEGVVRVLPIERAFAEGQEKNVDEALVRSDGGATSASNGKDRRLLENWEALSVNDAFEAEWQPVNEVIRHETEKDLVKLQHKLGESTTTRDHSYVVEEDGSLSERPPELVDEPLRVSGLPNVKDINTIDIYDRIKDYVREYTDARGGNYEPKDKTKQVHTDGDYVWFGHENQGEYDSTIKLKREIEVGSREGRALLRLLGTYVAEGSSSTEETSDGKYGASISESDHEVLSQLEEDYNLLFENAVVSIIDSDTKDTRTVEYETQSGEREVTYDDGTYKLQMMNELSAVFFRELAGQTSRGKKVPDFIYHLPKKEQDIFLDAVIEGDGSREFPRYNDDYAERNFDFETTSRKLAGGLSLLLIQRGKKHSLKFRDEKDSYTIRTCDYYRDGREPVLKEIQDEETTYVYDLSIGENQNFVDAVGGIVLHNTDSTLVELGGDLSLDDVVDVGLDIEDRVNESYDEFAVEEFDAEADGHRWDIEFEKVYERFFQAGRKKRYAGKLVWKEGKHLDEPDVDITGFEYRRSDVARITKRVQEDVIEMILDGEGFDEVSEYLQRVVEEFKEGDVDLEDVGIPGGIGQKLSAYDSDTAQVKGARYANQHFETNFKSGSKPKRVYIERAADGYPPTDVICFDVEEQVPEGFRVDEDKMLEKTVQKPLERILEALGWSWSEVVSGQRQQGLGSFG